MIIDDDFLDSLAAEAKESPRLRQNYDMRNSADDCSQRMLNVLQVGTKVPIHRHQNTAESIFIVRGVIEEIFYDAEAHETARYRLDRKEGKYAIQVPAGQWHTLEVIEPAVIFEVKDGKYEPMREEDLFSQTHE
jgi:Cupin domain.